MPSARRAASTASRTPTGTRTGYRCQLLWMPGHSSGRTTRPAMGASRAPSLAPTDQRSPFAAHDVLCAVKAEAAEVTNGPQRPAGPPRTDSMRRVLDEAHATALGHLQETPHVARAPR